VVGIDYGQCLMTPSGLRNPRMFGDIAKMVGKQDRIPQWIHRMRQLKEMYGTYSDLKEDTGMKSSHTSWKMIVTYAIFKQKESELLEVGTGTRFWVAGWKGIRPNIVSSKKTLGRSGPT
jgi:hypothetical protein